MTVESGTAVGGATMDHGGSRRGYEDSNSIPTTQRLLTITQRVLTPITSTSLSFQIQTPSPFLQHPTTIGQNVVGASVGVSRCLPPTGPNEELVGGFRGSSTDFYSGAPMSERTWATAKRSAAG